jgi:hypothetical protein
MDRPVRFPRCAKKRAIRAYGARDSGARYLSLPHCNSFPHDTSRTHYTKKPFTEEGDEQAENRCRRSEGQALDGCGRPHEGRSIRSSRNPREV